MERNLPKIMEFLRTGIWVLPVEGLSRTKAFFVRTLKILLLAFRGFLEDKCTMKASSLTFFSLLSVVPIAAMFFGIAKGFGFEKRLQAQLLEKFAAQEDVLRKVFEYSDAMLRDARGGVIAGIGVVLLFWSVIKVMGYIEHSFNDIWKVEKGRSLARKCSDYLSAMVVCPVIFIMSSSLTVTMAGRVEKIAEFVSRLGVPAAPILFLLDIVPFLLIWALFAFVYIYMPNTKVRFSSGLIAAVATGTVYQATQWFYIAFQIGVSRTNAIYGSFAALPLFLAWIQVSWLIVLLGAELSFAIQNVDVYGYPADTKEISPFSRKILSLLVARLVIRNFARGEKPFTAPAVARELGMSYSVIREILSDFSRSGLFSITIREEYEEPSYQPALDIHRITVKSVLDSLEKTGSVDLAFPPVEKFREVKEILESFGKAVEQSPANRLVIDL